MIAIELVKQARWPRPWVTLGLMAAVPTLLTVVIGLARPAAAERVGDSGSVVTGTSGLTLPLIALSAMVLFLLPLAVAVYAGEAVAGEAASGGLRYLLAHPVSRLRILASKAAVAAAYSLAAVLVAAGAALVSGVLDFGWRPLTVVDLDRTTPFHVALSTWPPGAALVQLGLASGVIALSLTSTFAFTLLLSTLTRSPFSAVAGGLGLGLVSRALDNVPGFQSLGPWLPMTDSGTTLWTGLFSQPVKLSGLGHLALVQGLYTTACLLAAVVWFTRSDVFS